MTRKTLESFTTPIQICFSPGQDVEMTRCLTWQRVDGMTTSGVLRIRGLETLQEFVFSEREDCFVTGRSS